MTKPTTLNSSRLLGSTAGGALLLLLITLLCPFCASTADAFTNTTRTAEVRAALHAAATVSVALDSTVNLDVTPTSTGTFTSSFTTLKIATNNPEGYTAYINTSDSTTNLQSTDSHITTVVPTLSTSTAPAGFTNNTWGYAFNDNNYHGISTTATELISTDSMTQADTHTLSFGAKVDTALPAGEYSNSVLISVVANPLQITNLSQLVYMQDITPSLCNTAEIGFTKQLYDVRDGKSYWIGKMVDGQCWMNQNLDYDLVAGKTLTNGETDINNGTEWQISASTLKQSDLNSATPTPNPSNTTVRSWDLGKYVYATPTDTTACLLGDSSYGFSLYNFTLADCANFQAVTNWQNTFSAAPGTWHDSNYDLVAADSALQSYDAHYLVGNYYSWSAATLESGNDLVSPGTNVTNYNPADAPNSICPKGWQLPKSGMNDKASEDKLASYYRLLISAGWKTHSSLSDGTKIFGPTKVNNTDILSTPPLYFTHSGAISGTTLTNAGNMGRYWESTAYTDNIRAYFLQTGAINSNAWVSHYDTSRANSLSIRCVAK